MTHGAEMSRTERVSEPGPDTIFPERNFLHENCVVARFIPWIDLLVSVAADIPTSNCLRQSNFNVYTHKTRPKNLEHARTFSEPALTHKHTGTTRKNAKHIKFMWLLFGRLAATVASFDTYARSLRVAALQTKIKRLRVQRPTSNWIELLLLWLRAGLISAFVYEQTSEWTNDISSSIAS